MTLIQLRRNPRELTEAESSLLQSVESRVVHFRQVDQVKRTDCTVYNACLSQAISGRWEGFSCADCTAYAQPDQFQRESDMLALSALGAAVRIIETDGKIQRKRGNKGGAESKGQRR